ncbi:hypothetical protein Taro_027766 [Colocasia esculenta]|uniref:Uncharacterized protein n=1 Tax=Colocasia esculenta TaxID=4460 RepID=A0A843VPS0_COLES|nr:hypothetical protein [Colocasia esculenta]
MALATSGVHGADHPHPRTACPTWRQGRQRWRRTPTLAERGKQQMAEHGHVVELLVAEELWNDHKKLIFFPFSSSAACTNCPLEINQSLSPGRVEELLVAEELWNDHKKLIFFPFSSAATCTNCPLEIDQRRRPRT